MVAAMKQIISTIVLGVCFAAIADAQSLADLARQERARKAGEAKIKISNENLNGSKTQQPVEPKPAVAEPPAPPAPAPAKSGVTDRKGRDEKWWRGAFADARADLSRAEDQIKLLQAKLNQVHIDYLQKSDMYNRELRLSAEIAALDAEMTAQHKNVEKAQQKIEELQDELRRSGGLPGWSR